MKSYYRLFVVFAVTAFYVSLGQAQDPFKYDTTKYGAGYSNGIAWGDYNNDGYQDFYISNGHQNATSLQNTNLLYKNNGDGTFDSVSTAGSIVTDGFVSGSSTWGDYDNDGDLDLFVAEVYRVAASFPNEYTTIYSLYENNGDGTFTRSDSHGDLTVETTECGAAAAWADYDNDSYLDLGISTQYIKFSPVKNNNALYKNNQDGTFTKQSNTLTEQVTQQGGVTWADYDKDGDQDAVFAAGYEFQSSWLFTNTGSDFDTLRILSSEDTKGASWGDYDNDGDLDLLFTISGANLDAGAVAQENVLFRNDNGTFTQVSAGELTSDTLYTYTSAWGDYDNDGDLDVFIGNSGGQSEIQKSYLYVNNGDGTFSKLLNTVLSDSGTYVRVAAWADYDNDGDLDLMTGRDGKNRFFINQINNGNHFLSIQLKGSKVNSAAIGCIVKVKATINGTAVWQMRDISGQTGFGGQNSLRAHFGLGDATVADSVVVIWSGTTDTTFAVNVAADQFIIYDEADLPSAVSAQHTTPGKFVLEQNYPNPFNPTTTIAYSLEKAANIKIELFNTAGQKLRTLYQGKASAGKHLLTVNAGGLASGIYLYRLTADGHTSVRKMIIVK